jgi:hypothetical protein
MTTCANLIEFKISKEQWAQFENFKERHNWAKIDN